MALHDNPLWILSHIQNSFVVSDSTGNSELVLTNDHKVHLPALAKEHEASVYLDKGLEIASDEEDDDDQISRSIGENYVGLFYWGLVRIFQIPGLTGFFFKVS